MTIISEIIAKIDIFLLNFFIIKSPLDYFLIFEFLVNLYEKLNECINNPI